MSNTLIIKNSPTLGKIPTTSDITYGELAINYADGKLYYRNIADQIKSIGSSGGGGGTLIVGSRGGPVNITITGGSFNVTTRAGTVSISI
jgi:hypothetical protein